MDSPAIFHFFYWLWTGAWKQFPNRGEASPRWVQFHPAAARLTPQAGLVVGVSMQVRDRAVCCASDMDLFLPDESPSCWAPLGLCSWGAWEEQLLEGFRIKGEVSFCDTGGIRQWVSITEMKLFAVVKYPFDDILTKYCPLYLSSFNPLRSWALKGTR